jgi:hypothetical protein
MEWFMTTPFQADSFVPDGTAISMALVPSLERLGYCLPSLTGLGEKPKAMGNCG